MSMHHIFLASLALAVFGGIPLAATELGIKGAQFTLDGKPTFLLGISYYGALGASDEFIRRDLDDMQQAGLNWIRVWATWAAFGNDVSAVDADGHAREPFMTRLKELVAECDRRGVVVDITLSRGNGVTGPPRLQSLDSMQRAVDALVEALRPHRNWYLDLANERNIRDRRYATFADLKVLRDRVKQLDPARLVTVSHAGDIPREELREYLQTIQVDFISPHRPRNGRSLRQTAAKTRQYLAQMRKLGRVAPVHYQEPFRRGFRPQRWEPRAEAFLTDLKQAIDAGAAGWCFHNGDQKNRPESKPRRSFDMREQRLFDQFDPEERQVLDGIQAVATRLGLRTEEARRPAPKRRTRLTLANGQWRINGKPTHPGSRAEGLLMNVRMVNAVFEDRNRPDFDPDSNTDAFLTHMPDYVAHGVSAFTICLQGGFPGYEGAINSAFDPDGRLRPSYMERVGRVIEACDVQGAVVILGCFYQRQDQLLRDAAAVRSGVVNVARWIQQNGFTNVALEIANEFPHPGFDHAILKSPEGEAELIRLAKQTAPGLLVSASGIGDGRLTHDVAEASDFLLVHFNGTPVDKIPDRIAALKKFGKPIVCNEDDKLGATAARAAEASVAHGASWGLMLKTLNQYAPFEFNGAADDPIVYAKLKELTSR